MATITKTIQILTLGAGSETAKVLYEVQTSDTPTKRLIVARTSEIDSNVYFLDHDALEELAIFDASVIALYEDTWPVDLSTQLTQDGALPSGMNAKFATADFGKGKVGLVAYNGYNYVTGSFDKVTKTTTASATATDPADPQKWYQKPLTKVIGWTALAAGAVVGLILLLRRK